MRLRILYLSRNMSHYTGAMYQRDVMEELSLQADVSFYGPGFPHYHRADTFEDIINKRGGDFDAVILGHAWLSDREGENIDPHPSLNWAEIQVPKAFILNKEYVNLKAKLDYVRRAHFDIAFSHHHEVEKYTDITGTQFFFWPFAFSERMFEGASVQKKWDLAFSGLLQNQNLKAEQSDIRARIMRRLYWCFGDLPICKQRRYANYKIFWNAVPRTRWQARLARIARKHRFLAAKDYVDLQAQSRIYLNSLSPIGLVSPRFAENMASKALVLCEEATEYERIFPRECLVTFGRDLEDFDEKLQYYLSNEKERQMVVDRAYDEAWSKHKWSDRVSVLLEKLREIRL